MTYPPYPGQYQPYPQQGGAPGGGTAITAGVLASIGAAGQLLGGLLQIALGATQTDELHSMYHASWYPVYTIVAGLIAVIAGAALAAGAVTLFRRRPIGRTLIVAGCALTIVIGIAGIAVALNLDIGTLGGASHLVGGVGGVFGLIFPIITIVLTLVPATARWLAAVPASAGPYPYPAAYPGGGAYGAQPGPYTGQPGAYPGAYPGQPAPYPGPAGPIPNQPGPNPPQPGAFGGQPGAPQYPGQPGGPIPSPADPTALLGAPANGPAPAADPTTLFGAPASGPASSPADPTTFLGAPPAENPWQRPES